MMRNLSSLVIVLLASLQLAKACTNPLGMESGAIKDSQIAIGDNIGTRNKEFVRYNHPEGWCTHSYPNIGINETRYIQVDLKVDYTVSAILLRRGGGTQKSYSYGKVIEIQWKDSKTASFGLYKSKDGPELKLNETRLEERINFEPPLCARYLRILPFLTEYPVCMRFEILGCNLCHGSPATSVSPTTQKKSTAVTTAKAASVSPTVQPASDPTTNTKKDTTNGILPSPKPGKRSSKPMTILIVAIVLSICFCVIIAVCLYRFRHRLKCLSKGRSAAKPEKKKFDVKMEAMYSDVNTNEELEKLAIEETQATDEMETNTYSEVYTAPIISRPKQSMMATEHSLYANEKLNQASQYVEPDINNAKEHYYEPIYAGSQIYDNPYQALTASSIYVDPNIMDHNGT